MWHQFARRVQYWRGSLVEEWGVARSLLIVGCVVLSLVVAQALGVSRLAAAVAVAVMVIMLVLLVPSEEAS